MLDPACLRAFIAVAELEHFARAADLLGVAQPVISKRLQRLEDQLGVSLIERGKRQPVRMTPAGSLFLETAREGVAALIRVERLGQCIARGEAGPVRIAYVFSAIMTGVLPRMIRALRHQLPDIEIEPTFLETPEQIAAIADGRIDFGIARPRPTYPAGLTANPIHSENVILALGSDHRLNHGETILARDLTGERFIVPQFHEEAGLIDIIHGIARSGSFRLPEIVRTADFITAAGLAAANVGIAAVPESLSRLQIDGLVYRVIEDHEASLDLVVLHRADAPASARRALLSAMT